MVFARRIFVVVAVAASLGGCAQETVDLADVLASARGQIEDGARNEASVDELLAAARGRPVSVSFAYVGCGGGKPRMERLAGAARGLAEGETLHIVLNAVDDPNRYVEVVRDLTGTDRDTPDPNVLRLLFVRKGERWPQETSKAVNGIMRAMGLRFGKDRYVETVSGIGLFDKNGAFVGIRY